MNFPKLIRVRQSFPDPILENIPGEIKAQLIHLNLGQTLEKGQTVAVACSSRGIANYSAIVKSVITGLKDLGL